MARVGAKNTLPELILRRALWRMGLRYTLHPQLPGRPDLVFIKARVAVFVDGCFWHRCPAHSTAPRTNSAFWMSKLSRNVARDHQVRVVLQALGWTVVRVWEHSLAYGAAHPAKNIARVVRRKTTVQER